MLIEWAHHQRYLLALLSRHGPLKYPVVGLTGGAQACVGSNKYMNKRFQEYTVALTDVTIFRSIKRRMGACIP
jgi:hypothetical protein